MSRERSNPDSTSEGALTPESTGATGKRGRAAADTSPLQSVGNQALLAAFSYDPRWPPRDCRCYDKADNLAVQRRLPAGGIQRKSAGDTTNDAHEHEADRIAERIVDQKTEPCHECKEQAERIPRRERALPSPATRAPIPVPGDGRTLDPDTRAEMEEHFGHDLGSVRIHTGPQADRSAQLLNARAYTLGQDIVFRDGEDRPETTAGKRLLAHELAHVVHAGGGSTLRRSPDLRKISISPEWARGLTDFELSIQATILQTYLSTQTGPETMSPDYLSAQQNLEVLEDEQRNRMARPGGFNVQQPQMVPRPPGLPLDDAYTLQELTAVPSAVAAQIPEGQIVTLSQDELEGKPPAADRPYPFWPGLAGGSRAGLSGADAALMRFGLAPAGDFAIGLVAIPPAQPNPFGRYFNLTAVENPFEWAGHTAVYVRQGGQITIVRGYNPRMSLSEPSTIWNVAKNYSKVFGGKMGVPGEITSDPGLFRSTSVRTVEYPVTPDVAAKLVADLPPLGTPAAGQPPLYSAPPSTYASEFNTPVGCEGTNCGLWATRQAEGPLGGRFGVAGQEPIVDIPVPGQAAQGKLYGMMDPKSGAPLAEMPDATGSPTVGGVSTALRVLKWGGRIFVVVGGVKLGYDIVTAPEGERAHVAFVGGSSFVGGFAGGAALGLVCGPGAPVCSVVTGIVGGIAGALGAGYLAEAAWNFGERHLMEPLKEAATTASEVMQDLEERKIQQLVEKSGGTMPPAVQDYARRAGPVVLFAP